LIVYWIELEWLNEKSRMPHWLTEQGRRGSLYEWILIALLGLLVAWQVLWMRSIVKSKLVEGGHGRPE
jgi:hypothetical protein